MRISRKNTPDLYYMNQALKQAKKAYENGETPIGCVIVKEDQILARGYNHRNQRKSVTSHAEIEAIRKACKKIGDWRLDECTMYVTLEPCPMCAGALIQARVSRVVIGCMNPKAGCAGSVVDLLGTPGFHHTMTVEKGVLEEECSQILTCFFKELRLKNKKHIDKE